MKKIIDQQKEELKEVGNEVSMVMETNEKLVRKVAEGKRSVVIVKVKEENIPLNTKSEREATNVVENILKNIHDEESSKSEDEIEEVSRIGRYESVGKRPIRVTLRSQSAMEELQERAFMLKGDKELKNVYITKILNEEERNKLNELKEEVKRKAGKEKDDVSCFLGWQGGEGQTMNAK